MRFYEILWVHNSARPWIRFVRAALILWCKYQFYIGCRMFALKHLSEWSKHFSRYHGSISASGLHHLSTFPVFIFYYIHFVQRFSFFCFVFSLRRTYILKNLWCLIIEQLITTSSISKVSPQYDSSLMNVYCDATVCNSNNE